MPRSKECRGEIKLDVQGERGFFVSFSSVECIKCPLVRILSNRKGSNKDYLRQEDNIIAKRILDRFCQQQPQFTRQTSEQSHI